MRTFGYWDVVKQSGICSLLILAGLLWMAVVFVSNFRRRRKSWQPLWLGVVCVLLGVLAAVLGIIEAYDRVAALGGASGPADLAQGIASALVMSAFGIVVLIAGTVMTMVLNGRARRAEAFRLGNDPDRPRDIRPPE